MAYADLQEFLQALEERGLLKRIEAEVSPFLEVTEISDLVVKKGGPALYFSRVKGSPYPLVTNLFGSQERMSMALGVKTLDEVGERIREYLELPFAAAGGWLERLKAVPRAAEAVKFLPRMVKNAPCQEVVETDPDLFSLPVLQCWPLDGGRFITLPLVFTKDVRTGRRNCGMYRMQVYDAKTTGMHWHLHKDGSRHLQSALEEGKRLEAAAVLGGDPATIYAATAPLPQDVDEMVFASFLRREPVEMVKCRTVDLEVPARAEFVLEGYVEPGELRKEGPFGDHTGFYSPADDYPVFHLTCLTRKRSPVYPSTIVGRPPMEDAFLGKATERIFLPLLQQLLPEVVDMHFPPEGVFHNCLVVSIKKRYPGQARKVMQALWGMSQAMFTKLIIVVDEHVDVQDMPAVWWRVFNNIDPRRDVTIVEGPLDALDHASTTPFYGSKMGIDATRKLPEEGHRREWPRELEMIPQIKELVARRWREYGFDPEKD
ncbi:MAG: menaquinone biosynthesis decarboxylase [Peptococcaceae bacterium]|jgi:4-hydroxy-3-polyprenylbenzoate decarboxylase|nr:menaquinone biosynthesis decarboxylase [Peptococcaceae bacterium]MDH7524386.1 menaquinone biosynthesis decarboxylase [Peptococcaceae bacterium]